MIQSEFNLVLKYCEVLDEFVKIRVFSEEDARELLKRAALGDKARFQREVVLACIADYNESVLDRIDEREDHGGLVDVEELLYLLCVDVNPTLDIHQVSVQLSSEDVAPEFDSRFVNQVKRKNRNNLRRILTMEDDIKRRVIGQDRAVVFAGPGETHRAAAGDVDTRAATGREHSTRHRPGTRRAGPQGARARTCARHGTADSEAPYQRSGSADRVRGAPDGGKAR